MALHQPPAPRRFAMAAVLTVGVLIGGSIAVAANWSYWSAGDVPSDLFPTEYEAVLLSNGDAYYGKLERLDSTFAVLTDVFYVRQRAMSDELQVKFVLVKRGGEWHRPDRMVLNANHVVFIEPVTPDSEVAKFIAKSQKP